MAAASSSNLQVQLKAFLQLPLAQTLQYAIYRLKLQAGLFDRQPAADTLPPAAYQPDIDLLAPPAPEAIKATLQAGGVVRLLSSADEIAAGQVRLFGGPPVPLNLATPGQALPWAEHERGAGSAALGSPGDVKLVWEPARFGWACTLARAFLISTQAAYPLAFKTYLNQFLQHNPPYYGWNWVSAQEAGLRLISLAFCYAVLNPALKDQPEAPPLGAILAAHAERIPPTLAYARAQNNNHLLSEAAALYTAGSLLPGHPSADRWRALGWRWFHHGLQSQITTEGVYIQHSTNYHRLMLQLALWVFRLARVQGQDFPSHSLQRLQAAATWLLALADAHTGQVPNLGPNDGAYVLPLTIQPFDDYRPVLQAAAAAFLGRQPFAAGPWDEMRLWLVPEGGPLPAPALLPAESPLTLRSPDEETWGYLRAARFTSRPGHADQLHVDLWWRGINLARDAGTYRYTSAPPWDNALIHTDVHNTVALNGQDQMTPAGRFLFLDWAQAEALPASGEVAAHSQELIAHHDGYRRLGAIHQRKLELLSSASWLVRDEILPRHRGEAKPLAARLHWLLPDWPWQLTVEPERFTLTLESPYGPVLVHVRTRGTPGAASTPPEATLHRAGQAVFGPPDDRPTWGWYAPTYNVREPALSFRVIVQGPLPLEFTTRWHLPIPASPDIPAVR